MIVIVGIKKPNTMIHDIYVVLLASECQSGVHLNTEKGNYGYNQTIQRCVTVL